MKYRLFLLFVCLTLCLKAGVNDITPRVGVIEIYGARKVSPEKIRQALGANPGDPMPSRLGAEERIDKLSGVVISRVEAACCEGHNMVLYVGVQEKDGPHMAYHETPTGEVTLPADLMSSYRDFLDQVGESIRGRNADEDLTQGYSLMEDPECRRLQQSFVPEVATNLAWIDRVVREAADPEQRSAAAYLMQYGPRGPHTTPVIVNALQYALQDSDDAVRENAARALKAVAVGAKLHPEQNIRLEPTWFVEMMNSVVWSDRRDASHALVNLTDQRDPDTLALLRERALPSVLEMARWHDLQQALPAFILAGRIAGMDDAAIKNAWVNGDRDAVLKKAAATAPKRSGFLHHARDESQ